MGKQKLKGKDLRKIGYKFDKEKSLPVNIMAQHFQHLSKVEQLDLLVKTADDPEKYTSDERLLPLAEEFMDVVEKKEYTAYKLEEEPKKFSVYGKKFIDQNTIKQMETVMRLPVVENGALMPDAHVGYGLPIGGVVATQNEIIPYGVGLDIGCRMALTIFDAPIEYAMRYRHKLNHAIKEHTYFGMGCVQENLVDHEMLDRSEFQETDLLRKLHGKLGHQIGTSGSGNHFVEFGRVEIDDGNLWDIPKGNYLGLLTHSGSRGFGAIIGGYYTQVAMDVCRLLKGAQHLAWLDLDKAEGMEYWMAMNSAGDYAKVCHEVIHEKLSKSIGC
ncbi:MAG: RtcB family protein [Crocinitomicaceae bacterium]|nr:RtcB family protein [Crocinitomicaceae bacterium]